jgi:hypothetical protein
VRRWAHLKEDLVVVPPAVIRVPVGTGLTWVRVSVRVSVSVRVRVSVSVGVKVRVSVRVRVRVRARVRVRVRARARVRVRVRVRVRACSLLVGGELEALGTWVVFFVLSVRLAHAAIGWRGEGSMAVHRASGREALLRRVVGLDLLLRHRGRWCGGSHETDAAKNVTSCERNYD